MSKEIAEFAYDLHAGLSTYKITEFDDLNVIGMAAAMSVHIKGLGEIDFEVMRKVSDHLMSIPSTALEAVLGVLEEIEFVTLLRNGRKISKVIPKIPVFEDIYNRIGEYAGSECQLNDHEQATLQILTELQRAPVNKDRLFNQLGIDKPVFDRCISVGEQGGILSSHTARGRNILISPFYFADNLDELADLAVSAGSNAIQSALSKVRGNQGWPLSLVIQNEEIGGSKLSKTELALIQKLSREGIVKPPTIKFQNSSQSFLFTPKPGAGRLNAANREIYERAMAIISTVRKGQLLPNAYKIHNPHALLRALRDRGSLSSNSEARDQYLNLVYMKVATLVETSPRRWQLRLVDTPENVEALNLAITLLATGELAGMEVNQEARIALTKGEEYIQSLIAASELKRRERAIVDPEANHEFEQLILKLD